MTFSLPSLPQINPSDTDYVAKWEQWRAALNNTFAALAAELAALEELQGTQIAADLRRRISGSDPNNGVIGAYSFVFVNAGSGVVRLDADNSDGVSYCVINGVRRQRVGDLSFALSALGLTDATYTVYAGLDVLGDVDVSIGVSTTIGNIDLPLYAFQDVVSGSGTVHTITRIRRIDRSLLLDNTLLQLMLEKPLWFGCSGPEQPPSSGGNDHAFYVPFAHRISKVVISCGAFASSPTWQISIKVQPGGTTVKQYAYNQGSDGHVGRIDPVAPFNQQVMPAFQAYSILSESTPGVTFNGWTAGIEVIPSYNVPTA